MNGSIVFTERKTHLARKLGAIRRLMRHLEYSRNRLVYPISSVDILGEAELESVSALVERFGKLQDLLGNVFREMLILSGEDATDMNDVLSRLEKVGVLDSADNWRALRMLRNLGAHDYDVNDLGKSAFVNEVAKQAVKLDSIAGQVLAYCSDKLNIHPET